jgi:hypothetical protein
LASPFYVSVDEETEVVYIADADNNRIQRWFPNALNGTTIAGGEGSFSSKREIQLSEVVDASVF